jgi:hypothetical protein
LASTLCAAAKKPDPPPPPPPAPLTTEVPQIELAKTIVKVLGLQRFLPPHPTPFDYFALLMVNGISPAGGWVEDQSVTRYDLARCVVLSLHQADKVTNPENPQSWIDYCVSIGIRVDTVGLATEPLQPLSLPLGPTIHSGHHRPRPLPTGDVQFGPIMQPIRELFIVGPRPRPVTPTAPVRGARI